jgi:Flp pilus assembly pilin Flp
MIKTRRSIAAKKGQTLVEYALLLGFVSIVAVGVMVRLVNSTQSDYSTINKNLTAAQSASSGPSR